MIGVACGTMELQYFVMHKRNFDFFAGLSTFAPALALWFLTLWIFAWRYTYIFSVYLHSVENEKTVFRNSGHTDFMHIKTTRCRCSYMPWHAYTRSLALSLPVCTSISCIVQCTCMLECGCVRVQTKRYGMTLMAVCIFIYAYSF